MLPDLILALDRGVALLATLGLPYVIGGSLASSAHGEPRPSGDVDLVIDLPPDRIMDVVGAFHGDFYVAESAVREAVARESSFNVIHLQTVVKLDFFVMGRDPLRRLQMARRRLSPVDATMPQAFAMSTAEDIVLQKLAWYRKGSGVSDRQWRDVLGVLKLQEGALDVGYLRETARESGLTELLDRAMREAGVEQR